MSNLSQTSFKSVQKISPNREHKIYLLKNSKLHKFATCNLNLETKLLSDLHYSTANI